MNHILYYYYYYYYNIIAIASSIAGSRRARQALEPAVPQPCPGWSKMTGYAAKNAGVWVECMLASTGIMDLKSLLL